MQIAVLFTALGCFDISLTGVAEFTFENNPPPPPDFIHHVRARLFSCRGVEDNAANY
jgi:hypothetical protein